MPPNAQRMPRLFEPRPAFRISFSHLQETTYAIQSRHDLSHSSPFSSWFSRRLPRRAKAVTPALCAAPSPIPSGAVIPGATVHLTNEVSGFDQTTSTDAPGQFVFSNVPFNPYRISVSAKGFAPSEPECRDSLVSGNQPQAGSADCRRPPHRYGRSPAATWSKTDPTFHTDVDRDLFIKVPLESQSSSLSSLVTLTTPGVAADSNGLFHGLGDHASNSFSVDGQSITDQQSKVFSNQLPSDAIQSIEVISGAPPAEYGGQNQPGDRGHHSLRAGRYQAHRQHQHALMAPSALQLAASILLMAARTGEILSKPMA